MERNASRLFGLARLGYNVIRSHSVRVTSVVKPINFSTSNIRSLHVSHPHWNHNHKHGDAGPELPQDGLSNLPDYVRNHVFLTDLPFSFLPHFWKSFRNRIFEFMIRGYFDHEFSISSFTEGATQAVLKVSDTLANGDFETLQNMDVLSFDLLEEIKEKFSKMSIEQREFLRVRPEDILRKFIYEIGIIMDDETDEKFVEILFVVHGQHGLSNYRDELQHSRNEGLEKIRQANAIVSNALKPFGPHEFVCNYRFIRQFRSPSIDSTMASHWIINKLNHFRPLHYILKQHFEQPSSRF